MGDCVNRRQRWWVLGCALGLVACGGEKAKPAEPAPAVTGALKSEETSPAQGTNPASQGAAAPSADSPTALPETLKNGLLLAYAQFEVEGGKVLPKPGPARLEILTRKNGAFRVEVLEDEDSNVFHKAMAYTPKGGAPGILTFGGMAAAVKLWHRKGDTFASRTLWTEKFGGKWDRMRDGEVGDLYGDGQPAIAVATHDQGIVAALRPAAGGEFKVEKLGSRPDTFVHEIELGDLNGDNVMEVYATPSEPNKLEGGAQEGLVWRFVPKEKQGPTVAADLGNRHAKEILVADVDGDRRQELYVAVEALTAGKGDNLRIVQPVEIRRYDADTPPDQGQVIAQLPDRLCRFLTVGDVDGDGRKEMVAAAYRSGLWLLSPPAGKGEWKKKNIDRQSSGFEHAAVFADLDEDGKDELYVAADEQGELRRYVFDKDGSSHRETIHRRDIPSSMMTWNIMPVPLSTVDKP